MKQVKPKRMLEYSDKTIFILWVCLLLMVAISGMIPYIGSLDAGMGLDKIAHGLMYAVLACIPVGLLRNRKTALLLAMVMAPMGLLVEIVQSHIPGRNFSAVDMMANNLGLLIGVGLGALWRLKRHYARQRNAEVSMRETRLEKT